MPTKRKGLVIWGAGGHAKVVAEIVGLVGRHGIAAFVDDAGEADRQKRSQKGVRDEY